MNVSVKVRVESDFTDDDFDVIFIHNSTNFKQVIVADVMVMFNFVCDNEFCFLFRESFLQVFDFKSFTSVRISSWSLFYGFRIVFLVPVNEVLSFICFVVINNSCSHPVSKICK